MKIYKYFISYRYQNEDKVEGVGSGIFSLSDKIRERNFNQIVEYIKKEIKAETVVITNFILIEKVKE